MKPLKCNIRTVAVGIPADIEDSGFPSTPQSKPSMTASDPLPALKKKILSRIAAIQRQAEAAKKVAKLTKAAFKQAKQKFKEAKRAAKKHRKELKTLKNELAALATKKVQRKPAAKAAVKRSRSAPVSTAREVAVEPEVPAVAPAPVESIPPAQ